MQRKEAALSAAAAEREQKLMQSVAEAERLAAQTMSQAKLHAAEDRARRCDIGTDPVDELYRMEQALSTKVGCSFTA